MSRLEFINQAKAKQIIKELGERGWAAVSTCVSDYDADVAMYAFDNFVDQVNEQRKESWHWQPRVNLPQISGYVRRLGKEKSAEEILTPNNPQRHDTKVYVHWIKESERHARETIVDWPAEEKEVAEKFFREAQKIWLWVNKTWLDTFEALEMEFPGILDVMLPVGYSPFATLRFLRYEAPMDLILAQDHEDRGDCTLAVANNCPGLVGLNPVTNQMEPINPTTKQAAFFPALDLATRVAEDHPLRPLLKALRHGVRFVPDFKPTVGKKRIAIISFLDHRPVTAQ